MRKIFLATFIFCIVAIRVDAQAGGNKDAQDTTKPYLKYPTLPAFNIMELDSSTIFNTYNIPSGKVTALMLIDPGCKHCIRSIRNLVAGMDSLRDIDFYIVSPIHSMQALRDLYADYHLADQKNIKVVGRDYEIFFIGYYMVRSFPDVVLYDEHKKLIKLREGEFTATDLYKLLH